LALAALQVDASGATPPRVLMRWTKLTSASVSPNGPAPLSTADSSSHGIVPATGNGLSTLATTKLPSACIHVGPLKWLMTNWRP
jgi:hypothetical protein